MTKKENKPDTQDNGGNRSPRFNRRYYWFRAVLVTVLVFIFILWSRRASLDTTAYLWALGFAVATMGYFVVSYWMLNR